VTRRINRLHIDHAAHLELGLRDSGYIESENVYIDFRWAEGEK
jgi:hypothetical protein